MHCNVKQNATVMVDCIQMALDTKDEDQPCAKRPYSSLLLQLAARPQQHMNN